MNKVKTISEKIDSFKQKNDVHKYRELLDVADTFIASFPEGVTTDEELSLGINLIRELISITYIFSFKQYESDYELEKEIRYKKIKVFKLCIPESHKKLRGLTELLIGMRENIVG